MKAGPVILITGLVLIVGAASAYAIHSAIQAGKAGKDDGSDSDDVDNAILNALNGGGNVNNIVYDTPSSEVYATLPQGQFPLAKGQRSKYAWIMQGYLNCAHKAGLAVDGKWGDKSTAALFKNYQVSVITSFPHLQQLFNSKGSDVSNIIGTEGIAACAAIAARRFANAQGVTRALTVNNFTNFLYFNKY